MDFASYKLPRQDRRHVVLAPMSADLPEPFADSGDERTDYRRMFNEMQRLRGRILVADGAMPASDLTADGRHAAAEDRLAWHLLTLDRDGSVGGCVRMLVHPKNVVFEDLRISQSALAKCPQRGHSLRSAVNAEIRHARITGSAVVEVGGWVLAEKMRRSTEAVRLALGVWAWCRMIGGAVGLATATFRNHSACILGRIGGHPLRHDGEPILQYFEPKFGCDIQILRFASDAYSPRYTSIVESMCYELSLWPVLSAHSASSFPLCRLHDAVHEIPSVRVAPREAVYSA